MRVLIAAVNAKYIHTSLAVRLLYLAARKDHDAAFAEYTVKQSPKEIAENILARGCDVLALSCYIWSIPHMEEICRLVKAASPDTFVILGGPEVTYEPAHFLKSCPADCVIQGEGEELFPRLLNRLAAGEPAEGLPGVSTRSRLAPEVLSCEPALTEALGSPYTLPEDAADKDKRVLYFESSRGCPYGCRYCLSSLEKGMRFFSRDYLQEQLIAVCRSGAKTVKFLDRSFCARPEHALFVLKVICEHYTPGQQFQFEINADAMPPEVLDFLCTEVPKGLIRLEIGIQSTFEPANRAVGRLQDFEKLSRAVEKLQQAGLCDLHLDLIAGLPYEGFERFRQSFDSVYTFRPKELQLGFLKLLRGTELRQRAEEFGYRYSEMPPYEITESRWLTSAELEDLRTAASALDRYGNSGRFPLSLPKILEEFESPFLFFLRLGRFSEDGGFPKTGYQLHELFACLDSFTDGRYHTELMKDYYPLFRVKPKRWYPPSLFGKEKKRVLNALSLRYGLSPELLFRYTVIEELADRYMLVIYKDDTCEIRYYDKNDLFS